MLSGTKLLREIISAIIAMVLVCAFMPIAAFAEVGTVVDADTVADEESASLPSEYYLTNLGYVTPAKLQSPWGTCWTFAVASAVESSILRASDRLKDAANGEANGDVSDVSGVHGESDDAEDTVESDAEDTVENDTASGSISHPMAAIRNGSVSALGSADSTGSVDSADSGASALDSMDAPNFDNLNSSIDLSERAIGWFAHEPQTAETGGTQVGEGYVREDTSPLTQFEGGNFSIVTSSLIARQSLLPEEIAPYVYNGYDGNDVAWYHSSKNASGEDARLKDWSLDSNLRTNQDVGWCVSEVLELPSPAILETDISTGTSAYTGYNPEATAKMKETIMEVGALAVCINSELSLPTELSTGMISADTLGDAINYSTWSQYSAADTFVLNHAVSVVGWDDSYPVDAFKNKSGDLPPSPGAWLCKNNWGNGDITAANGYPDDLVNWGIRADGSSNGDDATGFFWLSFYDHTISTPVAYEVSPDVESNLYQYDYLGASEFFYPTTYTSDVLSANVFEADNTELITSIGGWTFSENDTAHTYVYVLPNSDEEVVEGQRFKEVLSKASLLAENESTFDTAGYHAIDLEDPVLVYKGEKFVVIQQVDTITTDFSGEQTPASYLNLEVAFVDSLDLKGVVSRSNVVSNAGETFVSIHGSQDWRSVDEYNEWYADLKTQGNQPVDMVFGNALIKAVSKDSTMSSGAQVYEHVKLDPVL